MLTLPERWSPDCAREPRLPLLGLPGHSLSLSDPVEVAERLGTLLPVRSCDPVRPARASAPFHCHMGGLQLGALGLVALWGTGLHGELEDPEMATLVVPYRGRGQFRIDRRMAPCRSACAWMICCSARSSSCWPRDCWRSAPPPNPRRWTPTATA